MRTHLFSGLAVILLSSGGCDDESTGPRRDLTVGDLATGDAVVDAFAGDGAAPPGDVAVTDGAASDSRPADAGKLPGEVDPVKVSWESKFTLPPQDAQGFSILKPSSDSRIIYVSSSGGSDTTGTFYSPSSPEVGADPLQPAQAIKPYKSVDKAMAQARVGYPDWVLLKRGDTWTRTAVISAKSGRAPAERALIGAYGPASAARPLIRTGTAGGVQFYKKVSFAAVVGLHFYAHHRDPASPDFVGFAAAANPTGMWSYASDATAPNQTILVEDCVFRFYSNNVVQGTEKNSDIVVRRCQFLDDYSTTSHSQGMYTKDASVLLEENLFDHNGWYKQSYVQLNDKAEGQATYFNHNTYFTNTGDTVFRRNLFLRASSIGNKFTANPTGGADQIMARNVLLDDNLYVEGEIGVSAGGNTDNGTGHRWENILIMNNVLLDIGRGRPTNRSLGWGIDVNDWDGGKVSGNTFCHYGDATVKNIYALSCIGHTRDLEITGNVISGLKSNKYAISIDGDPKSNITVKDNQLQLGGTDMLLISTAVAGSTITFAQNRYFTSATPASSHFQVKGAKVDFGGWVTQTGETGGQLKKLGYPDPDRTVETYMSSLGKTATLDAFISEAKKQSRGNWREAYTARAVNRYVRAGFALP